MDYQMFQTALGLHSLFASSLVLEVFYNWKRKRKVLSPHFVTSIALFLVFSLAFFVR